MADWVTDRHFSRRNSMVPIVANRLLLGNSPLVQHDVFLWCLVLAVYKYLDDHPEIVERPAALMRLTSRLRDVPYSPDMEGKSDLQIPMGQKCHRLELNSGLVVAAWEGRRKSSIRM
jgi:hypothetical protein